MRPPVELEEKPEEQEIKAYAVNHLFGFRFCQCG